ncbi:hypothetical protein CRG98_006196 [Punica granatum]|uniref:Uncharacterized protein n=1 Tax=Punica granatum TaxID=22663 RepID=A0A2I0KZX7_PUNGR|nr:hypothetical protein CRG98_006196 [Punica granatum]
MVNQLATNMNTNMAELMAMLRDQNRASSSYTPPSEHWPTVDPNPVVSPTFVSESKNVSFSAMTYVPAVYPVSDPLPPPPAPTAVPLPPMAFLLTDSAMHTLLLLVIPALPSVYTALPPTVLPVTSAQVLAPTMDSFPFQASQPQISFSYPAPPPLNIPPSEPGTLTRAAPAAPLTNFLPEAKIKQVRRMKKMEKTIRALQAGTSRLDYDLSQKFLDQYRFCAETAPTLLELSTMEMKENHAFEAYASEWRGKVAKHILPISEIQQVQLFHSTLKGVYYSHLLSHASSFFGLIEARKKLDMGIKLGRIEGLTKKKEEEVSKKHTIGSSRRAKDTTISVVNPKRQTPPAQRSRPIIRTRRLSFNRHPHNKTLQSKTERRLRDLLSRSSGLQLRKLSRAVPPSHLLAGNRIRSEAPHPNFDPTVQNQSIHCEFHQGALGHTTDNCWRLREKIQEMIDAKQISFNEMKSPNVLVNPLPDHGSSSEPTMNMISISAIGGEEDVQETPIPFVIEYVPVQIAVAFAPFVIKVPAKESYQDHRVPWNYREHVANTE